jgi:GntR family transcriptional repressor for pyruvate dehydrogenase complex
MNSIFTSIEQNKVYQKILLQIRKLIEQERLKPGDRLPSEREMAQVFGCSRASLREAFRVLESEGVLVSKHGEGRFVQEVHPLATFYNFDQVDQLKQSAILSFLEARETLEPKIAELAAIRAKKSQIETLHKIINNMKINLKEPEKEVSYDSEFHLAMAEASQNFVFVSMLRANLKMIQQVRRNTLIHVKRYEESIIEHQGILDAIEKKDTELASQLALQHVLNLKKVILREINNEMKEGVNTDE